MASSLIHFALIHAGAAASPGQPRVLHFAVDDQGDGAAPPHTPVHLLVLDARRMNPACLQVAFLEVTRLRRSPGVRHGVLVCTMPLLPIVLGAMRAGLRDIIHEPPTARQLLHLLRVATPGHRACARQLSALAVLVRLLASSGRASDSSVSLARREYALVQRADQLAHTETRLALERAVLEDREHQLRAGTRRLEREFAALQKDPDIARPAPAATPPTAHPFATDLQAIAARLDERAQALDLRERMLLEMETLLTAQLAGAHAQEAESWNTLTPAR